MKCEMTGCTHVSTKEHPIGNIQVDVNHQYANQKINLCDPCFDHFATDTKYRDLLRDIHKNRLGERQTAN